MKKLLAGCASFALFALTLVPAPAEAATPLAGRYKGTLTVRSVVDGTNARVKKVIPVAGTLASGKLLLVMAERPEVSEFTSSFVNCAVSDGAVTLQTIPGNFLPLFNVMTTTSAISGNVDLGLEAPPVGDGSVRQFLVLSLTRVGD